VLSVAPGKKTPFAGKTNPVSFHCTCVIAFIISTSVCQC